jgi:probable HAF family extracellular repeat protein
VKWKSRFTNKTDQGVLSAAKRCALAAMVAFGLTIACPASALPAYSITDLGTLGGNYSSGWGINNAGQVVGLADTAGNNHAVLWQNNGITNLGTLGGSKSVAWAINNAGQVVGFADTSENNSHAFLWQGGTMTDLGTLGGNYSSANGINGAGQVVGHAALPGTTLTPFSGKAAA